MIRISISIHEEQAALLRRWAREEDRPVSAIVRRLVEDEARRRRQAPAAEPEPDRCPHCGLPLGIMDLAPDGEAYHCPDCDERVEFSEAAPVCAQTGAGEEEP